MFVDWDDIGARGPPLFIRTPIGNFARNVGYQLVLIQSVRLIFGAQNVQVANPTWLSGGIEVLYGVVLPYSRLAIILFVALVVGLVWLILQRTRLGLQVRAVTQNRPMASCMGISAARVDMWTFGLGSGIAGLGGVALSQIGNVGPELGRLYIVDSFMVVVLGGVGNIAGTVVGALSLGLVNKMLEPVAGGGIGENWRSHFYRVIHPATASGLICAQGAQGVNVSTAQRVVEDTFTPRGRKRSRWRVLHCLRPLQIHGPSGHRAAARAE